MAYNYDPNVGPKVFIAYPHNPEHYEELQVPDLQVAMYHNPGKSEVELKQLFDQEILEHNTRQGKMIESHKSSVRSFVAFLQSRGVTVEYDQSCIDTGYDNQMRWIQARIEASQFVIVIATPSLKDFLRGDVPPESETLFVGDYFYNLIEGKSKRFLSVFLNRPKDVQLLPVSLEMSDKYQIFEPFDVSYERNDDLLQLYALLTDQNRFVAPSAPIGGVVPIPKKKGRVGRGVNDWQQHAAATLPSGAQHHNLFDALSQVQVPLTDQQIISLADKHGFYSQWKMLATQLGLSAAQIEACEVNSGGFNDSEKCLRMLKLWRNSGLYGPQHAISVGHLAGVLYATLRNMTMVEILHKSVFS